MVEERRAREVRYGNMSNYVCVGNMSDCVCVVRCGSEGKHSWNYAGYIYLLMLILDTYIYTH